MAIPLPKNLTKSYIQQRQQTLSQSQNVSQQENNSPVQSSSTQENLIDKYNSGKISLKEFQQLFPEFLTKTKYGGTSQTKSVQEYIAYLSSKGLSTKEAERQLPESSYAGAKGYGQKAKSQGPSIYTGGYSSTSGGEVSQGGQTTFQSSQGVFTLKTAPKNFTSASNFSPKSGGESFVYYTKQAPQAESQNTVLKKNLDFNKPTVFNKTDFVQDTRSTRNHFSNTRVVQEEPRITFTKVSNKSSEFVGRVGARLGSDFARSETKMFKRRFDNPEGFVLSPIFYKQKKSQSKEQVRDEAYSNLVRLSKTETISSYRETGANIALLSQYAIPFVGEARIGLDVASDVEQGKYFEAGTSIALGGAFKAGEIVAGKGFDKLAIAFSDTRPVLSGTAFRSEGKFASNFMSSERKTQNLLLGRPVELPTGVKKYPEVIGYKNITTERFVSSKIGKRNELALNTISLARSTVNLAGTSYIAGTVAQNILRPSQQINAGLSPSEVRSESIKSAKEIGYFSTGYKLTGGLVSQLDAPIYSLTTKNRKVPNEILNAPDIRETNFPKDTLNATKYISSVKNRTQTYQGSEQAKFFDKKIFPKQEYGFNVSAKKPTSYYPIAGNSEFTFAEYNNPKNPSFIFQINKKEPGTSGYRLGFELPTGSRAKANVTYTRGIKPLEVGSQQGSIVFLKGERGVSLVPTTGGLRTKTESEVLNVGKISKLGENKYTVETVLSKANEGLFFGKVFEIPEYSVSKSQRKFINPYTAQSQLKLLEGESAKAPVYLKASTGRELSVIQERSRESESYYNRKPVFYPVSSSSSVKPVSSSQLSFSSSKSSSVSSYRSYKSSSSGFSVSGSSKPSYPTSYRSSYGSLSGSSSKSLSLPSSTSSSISNSSLGSSSTGSSSSSSSSSLSISRGSSSSSFSRASYRPPYYPPSPPRTPINSPKTSYSNKSVFKEQAFGLFTKIRGKEKQVSGRFTRLDAFAQGTRLVKGSLRASFRVKPLGGESVQSRNLNPVSVPLYFSKKGFYVQKRGSRLGSIGERREIQSFKRKKSSRRGFL